MEENGKLIGIACAKLAIKELIENKVPITPMIIGYEMFAIYVMRENLIMTHDNEKFYKAGFCDGIRIILENLKSK